MPKRGINLAVQYMESSSFRSVSFLWKLLLHMTFEVKKSLYFLILILCFRASQYKANETPTWCNTVQVLFLQGHSTCFERKCPSSGVFKTTTADCTCNDNTCTIGRCTSFKYSSLWALALETCRVTPQKKKLHSVASSWCFICLILWCTEAQN